MKLLLSFFVGLNYFFLYSEIHWAEIVNIWIYGLFLIKLFKLELEKKNNYIKQLKNIILVMESAELSKVLFDRQMRIDKWNQEKIGQEVKLEY